MRGRVDTKNQVLGIIHGPWELQQSAWLELPDTTYAYNHFGIQDWVGLTSHAVAWNAHIWNDDVDQLRIITACGDDAEDVSNTDGPDEEASRVEPTTEAAASERPADAETTTPERAESTLATNADGLE